LNKAVWETPEEINLSLAKRVKNLRKRRQLTQKKISEVTGVSYGSIKLFERTGNISLLSLSKIAIELDCIDEIKGLFTKVSYRNIKEVINENK
jgi:transcriptional regulator with XRE-family HTH domain